MPEENAENPNEYTLTPGEYDMAMDAAREFSSAQTQLMEAARNFSESQVALQAILSGIVKRRKLTGVWAPSLETGKLIRNA